MATGNLPWERLSETDPADGVGICLSGGGLRAAMFGLGALQTLQEHRGLLYGPRAARYLSAVSGGSYVSAAFVNNAHHLTQLGDDGPAPMSVGSPEEHHVLQHGRYLITPRVATALRFLLLMTVNIVGFVVISVCGPDFSSVISRLSC